MDCGKGEWERIDLFPLVKLLVTMLKRDAILKHILIS